jgi:hypothetical protein
MRLSGKGFIAAALFSTVAACQSTPEDASKKDADTTEVAEVDPRRGEEVDRICFASNIRGFGETTRSTVVVNAGVNQRYLLEVFRGCTNLDHAQSLAFDSFSSCITRGDNILAFESFTGPSRHDFPSIPCRINKIYEWNKDAGEDAEEGGATEETASET